MTSSLSGSIASLGQSSVNGAKLAVADLNKNGGVLGKTVKLKAVDDESKPNNGKTLVRDMILKDKAVAILGPTASSVAAAEEGVATQNKIPIFFHTSNDLALTTSQYSKYAFQVVPNTYMEPQAIARYMAKQTQYKTYATIAPDYNFGHDSVNSFIKTMKSLGADIKVVSEQWPALGATDFSSYISAVLAAKPDVVYILVYGGDLITFTKQAEGYQFFEKTTALGFYGLDVLPVLKDKTPAGAIGYGRAPFFAIKTPEVTTFVKDYQAKYNEVPSAWSLLAYTAVQSWADGVKKAKSFDGDKVSAALVGATVSTIRGDITFRKCDNQAEVPEYLGVVSKTVDPKYGFPLWENTETIPANQIMMSCSAVKKLQP